MIGISSTGYYRESNFRNKLYTMNDLKVSLLLYIFVLIYELYP